MNIFLDDMTSLILVRSTATNKSITLTPTNVNQPTSLGERYVKLPRLGMSDLLLYLGVPTERPLGIVVPHEKDRVRTQGIHCSIDSAHRVGAPFMLLTSTNTNSPSPLVPKNTKVYVQHPAKIVLNMARRLRRMELDKKLSKQKAILLMVKLCLELCGTYSHDPFDPNHADVIYHVGQRLTREFLCEYLQAEGNEQGLSLARTAAALSYNNSGSPQESFLGPALFFTSRLGGLELCPFVANEALDLSPGERQSINNRIITPDFQLPDYNSVVEYLGEVHTEGDNPRIDHTRSLDYQTIGKREFGFWYSDVETQEHFLASAARIVSAISQIDGPDTLKRFRKRIHNPKFRARQAVLFSVFRPWLRGR